VVAGDLFAAGNTIDVTGEVQGSLRVVGSSITINGKVGRNILSAGNNLMINDGATIGGHITFAGAGLIVNAPVGGEIQAAVGDMVLNSTVGGDVNLQMGNGNKEKSHLLLSPKSVISGDLNYKSFAQAEIQAGAQILGKTNYTPMEIAKSKPQIYAFLGTLALAFGIFGFLSLLLMGLIIIYLVPKMADRVCASMKEAPWKNVGIGFVGLVTIPVAAIILFVTILGIPLGMILLFGLCVAMYLSKAFVAIAIGRLISDRFHIHKIFSLIFGLLLFTIVGLIPIIGWLAAFLATLWAFGAILKIKSEVIKEWR